MHTGEQREVWINLGRELFRTCKENQILAESALSGVIQNTNEQVKPLLQKLRLLYIETALYSNEPLKMAQARFERQMELEEMKTSVATVEGYLVEMGIDPEIIDLGLPNLKTRDILNYLLDVPAVLNAFTDVKELAGFRNPARMGGIARSLLPMPVWRYLILMYWDSCCRNLWIRYMH